MTTGHLKDIERTVAPLMVIAPIDRFWVTARLGFHDLDDHGRVPWVFFYLVDVMVTLSGDRVNGNLIEGINESRKAYKGIK